MAEYIPAVRAASPNAGCVVTEHEPGISADLGRGSLTFRQWLGRLARRRAWSRYERRVLRLADAIIVFTKSDEAALLDLLGSSGPPISIIPLRLPEAGGYPAKALPAAVRSDFIFVGNFRHPPNVDAAQRLLRSIFPMILRELPNATLSIVGADPPQNLVDAASDRMTVTGWVDDPLIYLAGAKVVLIPLRQGGGLRVKMLEACAAGKAIVASPMAVEGLSLRDGQEVVIAGTDEEFAARAVSLANDPAERDRLQRASRKWWEEEQDVGRWSAQYDEVYESLGNAS
jgi:glycosyltransferase involved in cell wall biosynthesis